MFVGPVDNWTFLWRKDPPPPAPRYLEGHNDGGVSAYCDKEVINESASPRLYVWRPWRVFLVIRWITQFDRASNSTHVHVCALGALVACTCTRRPYGRQGRVIMTGLGVAWWLRWPCHRDSARPRPAGRRTNSLVSIDFQRTTSGIVHGFPRASRS